MQVGQDLASLIFKAREVISVGEFGQVGQLVSQVFVVLVLLLQEDRFQDLSRELLSVLEGEGRAVLFWSVRWATVFPEDACLDGAGASQPDDLSDEWNPEPFGQVCLILRVVRTVDAVLLVYCLDVDEVEHVEVEQLAELGSHVREADFSRCFELANLDFSDQMMSLVLLDDLLADQVRSS